MSDKSHDELMKPDGNVNPIDTDYQIGQDNIALKVGPFGLDIHNRVFLISGLAVALFVFVTLAFQKDVAPFFGDLRSWLTSNLDWFFLSAGDIFVITCLALVVSPLGKVRLGGTEATPDYTYVGWFSMLFAAGMGIGLMFYGVSEPMSHYASSFGGLRLKTAFAQTGRHSVRRRAMCKVQKSWRWQPPFITGVCTLGLSTQFWRWDWRCFLSIKGCRSPCALCFTHFLASAFGAG